MCMNIRSNQSDIHWWNIRSTCPLEALKESHWVLISARLYFQSYPLLCDHYLVDGPELHYVCEWSDTRTKVHQCSCNLLVRHSRADVCEVWEDGDKPAFRKRLDQIHWNVNVTWVSTGKCHCGSCFTSCLILWNWSVSWIVEYRIVY